MLGSRLWIASCAAVLALAGTPPLAAGPAGYAFLEVPAGARASAMGGAFGTVAEGVEAAFWNPAGLAAVHGIQVTASHFEFLEGLRHAQFGVAGRQWGGGIGASLRAMYSEPIVERDALGNEIGTFGAHDLELALAYARELRPGIHAGGSVQVVRERIDDFAATTLAVGLGARWTPVRSPRLRLGASAHHLGPSGRFTFDGVQGEPVPLPASIQAGATYHLPLEVLDVRAVAETRFTRGRAGVGMVGLEATHSTGGALRAGLRLNDETTSASFGGGFALGTLRLDYAYVPYRLDLGDTHRFSLGAQF